MNHQWPTTTDNTGFLEPQGGGWCQDVISWFIPFNILNNYSYIMFYAPVINPSFWRGPPPPWEEQRVSFEDSFELCDFADIRNADGAQGELGAPWTVGASPHIIQSSWMTRTWY